MQWRNIRANRINKHAACNSNMITTNEKLALMRSFLASSYYCDFSIARTREEIKTIKDTLNDYKSYCFANIPVFSPELTEAMNQGDVAIQACDALLSGSDFTDLSSLANEIATLDALVGAL
jgi:hypothetical protein